MHEELQLTSGKVQLAAHTPALQTVPAPHWLPHLPQFAALDLVSTHVPEQSTWGLVHIDPPSRPLSELASELQLDAASKTANKLNNKDTTLFPTSSR